MIPAEAVEAAAKATFEFLEEAPWEPATFLDHDLFKDAARLALEAAAPHMLAGAWDEGEAAGRENADNSRGFTYEVEYKDNPYRPTP